MLVIKWENKREEKVIKEYSLKRKVTIIKCGFIPHPTIKMAGVIPNGLIGDEGLIKIKYSQLTTHVRFLLDSKSNLNISYKCNSKWLAQGENGVILSAIILGLKANTLICV
ncbi:hypothetical protein ME3_00415 [Bartonella melophagi K-2C]|uniref:Uncharacterized protein n=1 Tax=Bartonella melophagi K-2C TaxID=1094557 RepID=J0R6L0_9HYPH|nr:hypothetical protein ME3_00415 [Bartonella melophagi K-2C]